MMRIAVAQVHAPPVAQSSNEVEVHALGLDRLRGLMCATARGGGDLLVLPELWLGGYHTGGLNLHNCAITVEAEESSGPLMAGDSNTASAPVSSAETVLRVLKSIAREFSVAMLVSFPEREGNRFFIAAALIDRTGALRSHYRKTHLWGDQYEPKIFEPRDVTNADHAYVPATIDGFPDLPIGILVCYDSEFPEPARVYCLNGARLLIVPVAAADRCALMSRVVLRARAMENNVAAVLCNYPSSPSPLQEPNRDKKIETAAPFQPSYNGGSAVVGPDGTVLHMLDAHDDGIVLSGDTSAFFNIEATLIAEKEANLVQGEKLFLVDYNPAHEQFLRHRSRNPYLSQRRPALYASILSEH